ncbi:GIY-YIG nuclease family protein [Chryseomicrobium aureum]|uniref:GIY-YIG nuclease family protein n=1 Tax=Chryseomicrobium aureum TaxID=1441723 RepID=UPI00195E3AC9|nr:GIY-YIG nuclease family protein [Chryseomicrobium aureum]MBM7707296.1 putative endonuclease [Chryseomicrobium aureum]
MEIKNSHYFYVVCCKDATFYAGYAKNVLSRLKEHNDGKGAKYTRPRLPVKLVHFEEFETRSLAMKQEYAFKQLTRKQKEQYIEGKREHAHPILPSI